MKLTTSMITMSLYMSFYTMANALSAVKLSARIIGLITVITTILGTGGRAVIIKRTGS